jgi:hypothetical protein
MPPFADARTAAALRTARHERDAPTRHAPFRPWWERRRRVRCKPDNHPLTRGVVVRRLLLLVPLVLVLVAAPPAFGGGFATVGLSSTPAGIAAGQPWKVDITVLAHGRTPVEGMPATVRIRSGDTVEEFATKETGTPGVYHTDVVFPAAGVWSYEVVDGYIQQVHTFPDVRITGAPGAVAQPPVGDSDDGIAAGWLWGAGAALLLALAVLGVDRRRRRPAGSLKTA